MIIALKRHQLRFKPLESKLSSYPTPKLLTRLREQNKTK